MRIVDINQAVDLPLEFGRRKRRRETWVLTRRGRPVAAVVPVDDEDYFSMRLADDARFIEIIERSRASYKATSGIPLAEARRKYGVPPKSRRRSASRRPR